MVEFEPQTWSTTREVITTRLSLEPKKKDPIISEYHANSQYQ